MMMLAVSEIAEAWQADGPDDKLPQYSGYKVEIADCFIRLSDLLGVDGVTDEDFAAADTLLLGAQGVIIYISNALEAYRKSRAGEYRRNLCAAMLTCLRETTMEIIQAKRAYNATRADHSLEARRAADGKKI